MTAAVEALIVDLLASLEAGERPYGEVMDAWRTSCPRLPVWEEAGERGLIARALSEGVATVRLTDAGKTFLASTRARPA